MSEALRRAVTVEAVSVETVTGQDGQGVPSYAAPIPVEARVVREDAVVMQADGTSTRSTATLWFDGTQTPLPGDLDRLTLADGATVIVIERKVRSGLDGAVDHMRVRAREERA